MALQSRSEVRKGHKEPKCLKHIPALFKEMLLFLILFGVLPIFDVTQKKMKAGAHKEEASSSCPVFSHSQKLTRNGRALNTEHFIGESDGRS